MTPLDAGPSPFAPIELDGHSLRLPEIVAVARGEIGAIRLADSARARMDRSRLARNELLDAGTPIYGVTTGYGDSADRMVSPRDAATLQANMIRYHLAGVGEDVDEPIVRATLLIRANSLAAGMSGVRPVIVTSLLKLLAHGALPIIPTRGSVGASGDLVPLSYVASVLCGAGEVRHQGTIKPAIEALREIGLAPVQLEPKEGLGLINGTAFSTAVAVLATDQARTVVDLAEMGTALAAEALLADRGAFSPTIHEAKPHPGQIRSASRIAGLLQGSKLTTDHAARLDEASSDGKVRHRQISRPVQDRYSIRCAPQVIGVLRDTLTWVDSWLVTETNSVNDNPVFSDGPAAVHSGGNFYGGHVAMASDALKVAVANIADLLDRQVALLVDRRFNNGLPSNLVEEGDDGPSLDHGLKGLQLTMSAVTAEALSSCNPSSVFSRSTECHNQDKVSMSAMAARSARHVGELTLEACAIHLLVACQAVDLRDPSQCGTGTRRVHKAIRTVAAHVAGDRRLDNDIAAVMSVIGSLSAVTAQVETA